MTPICTNSKGCSSVNVIIPKKGKEKSIKADSTKTTDEIVKELKAQYGECVYIRSILGGEVKYVLFK
jgi:hypothetical protein